MTQSATSPAMSPGGAVSVASAASPAYILHPPLPSMTQSPPQSGQMALPIILNPELMQGSAIPFIAPQVLLF